MAWRISGDLPISQQLYAKLQTDILSGVYPPGSQFPPVRKLAMDHSVNPNTMQKVMGLLESEGLLLCSSTAGRFVTEDQALLLKKKKQVQESFLKEALAEARVLGIDKEQMTDFVINHFDESEENL